MQLFYLSDFVAELRLRAGLLSDTLTFAPELLLCAGIVIMLMLRLFKAGVRAHSGVLALFFTLSAL
ncbi:MAG: hypothetical protein ACRD36_11395, partial [Candidatus Acidiferrum sp.]